MIELVWVDGESMVCVKLQAKDVEGGWWVIELVWVDGESMVSVKLQVKGVEGW